MIVAKRKPFDELKQILGPYKKILTVGCGTCVSVCLAGGEKEAKVLNAELEMARKLDDNPVELATVTLERQCDQEYLEELDDMVADYDVLLSMACGVGIQFLAERFPEKPVMPGVDTTGLAVNQDVGLYEERCRSCGKCVLAMTGGICPVTMCAKGLYNGPCGGTNLGACEISPDQPCAWYQIHERLSKQDRLDQIHEMSETVEWLDQVPRMTIQPGYEKTSEEKSD